MSEKAWGDLTLRERDVQAAKAMGWVLIDRTPHPEHRRRGQAADLWYQGEGLPVRRIPHDRRRLDPSTDFCPTVLLDHVRLLEDAIERRGLWEVYIFALAEIVRANISDMRGIRAVALMGAFKLIRATPDQRAQAFVETMKGAHHVMGTE